MGLRVVVIFIGKKKQQQNPKESLSNIESHLKMIYLFF